MKINISGTSFEKLRVQCLLDVVMTWYFNRRIRLSKTLGYELSSLNIVIYDRKRRRREEEGWNRDVPTEIKAKRSRGYESRAVALGALGILDFWYVVVVLLGSRRRVKTKKKKWVSNFLPKSSWRWITWNIKGRSYTKDKAKNKQSDEQIGWLNGYIL